MSLNIYILFFRLRCCEAAYSLLDSYGKTYQTEVKFIDESYSELNNLPPVSHGKHHIEPTKVSCDIEIYHDSFNHLIMSQYLLSSSFLGIFFLLFFEHFNLDTNLSLLASVYFYHLLTKPNFAFQLFKKQSSFLHMLQ